MNKIFLKPIGGLSNRIRAIDSVLTIAQQCDKRLVVIWEKNRHLNCSYTDLFLNPPAFDLMETRSIRGFSYPFFLESSAAGWPAHWLFRLTQSKFGLSRSFFYDELAGQLETLRPVTPQKYASVSEFDICAYETFSGTVDALKDNNNSYIASCWRMMANPRYRANFLPAADIAVQIEELTQRFSSDTYGLHIRGTDSVTAMRYSSIKAFEDRILAIIDENPAASFYLASDEPAAKENLIGKFRSRMIFLKQPGYSRDSSRNIQNALIDLLCLAKTRRIFGSYFSTFSQVAAAWGGIEQTTVFRFEPGRFAQPVISAKR